MQKGKKFLSDLKLHSDYLKWREKDNRFETWEEACESIMDGHREKYKEHMFELEPMFQDILINMKSKTILASQRNLQFRGPQIERNNARMYNCTSTYVAYNKVFQDIFYLGLSGCGVGGGLLLPFVNNISEIQARTNGTKTVFIEDSIEGWADALGVLMSSFFVDKQPFPEYAGYQIKFDYSFIRPKGAFISGGFKAPGHEGLKNSLEKIELLLNNWLRNEGSKLRPIAVFDIICYASDAVLSGGVRRSALNMIVDPNDQEMIYAKTGNWRQENPQRARSNNSVILLRNEVTKEQFETLVNLNEGENDIGFVFANSWFDMFNPCFEILKIPMLYKGERSLDSYTYEELPKFIQEYSNIFGVQGCNLTEINAEACKTKEDFYMACTMASALGTLQAGYTNFPYLGKVTEEIFKQEALIGVSVTGWMNNPMLFNEEILRTGADIVKLINKAVALVIGINQAARTTCVNFCAL